MSFSERKTMPILVQSCEKNLRPRFRFKNYVHKDAIKIIVCLFRERENIAIWEYSTQARDRRNFAYEK